MVGKMDPTTPAGSLDEDFPALPNIKEKDMFIRLLIFFLGIGWVMSLEAVRLGPKGNSTVKLALDIDDSSLIYHFKPSGEEEHIKLKGAIVEIDSEGSFLYVICKDPPFLHIVDTDQKVDRIEIPLEGKPSVVDHNQDCIVVLHSGYSALTVVDRKTYTVLKGIDLPFMISHFYFADSQLYCVGEYGSDKILGIDLKTLEEKACFSLKDMKKKIERVERRKLKRAQVDYTGDEFIFYEMNIKIFRSKDRGNHQCITVNNPRRDAGVSFNSGVMSYKTLNHVVLLGEVVYFFKVTDFDDFKVTCYLFTSKTGRYLNEVPLDLSIHGTLRFDANHLILAKDKRYPLYPTLSAFKDKWAANAVAEYLPLCREAFRKHSKGKFKTQLSDEDKVFFSLLSTTAALSQGLIYKYLKSVESLYALAMTENNGYLRSIDGKAVYTELLWHTFWYSWFNKPNKAHVYVALFLEMDDPCIKGLYKNENTVKKKIMRTLHLAK